jgi:hypothetical protein
MRLFLFSSAADPDLGAAEDRGTDASRDADEEVVLAADTDVSAPPEDLGPESLRPFPDTVSG